MKKKALAVVLAAVMSLTMLVGCGGEPADNPGGVQGGNTGGTEGVTDITLKVWCPQNQVDTGIMDDQQKEFAAAHPEWNITWKTEIVGEDNCKTELLKDVEAGADVFFFASDQLIELVDTGAIAQLGGAAEQIICRGDLRIYMQTDILCIRRKTRTNAAVQFRFHGARSVIGFSYSRGGA